MYREPKEDKTISKLNITYSIYIFGIIFNVKTLVVFQDKDAIPYIENGRTEISKLDADRALRGMADYFYRESRFSTDFYDMAVAMTQ